MFPNPQGTLPLPLRPDLEQYKKLAKELLRAAKSTDSDAIRNWSTDWIKGLIEGAAISPHWKLWRDPDAWIRDVASFAQAKLADGGKLSDAQFVIARSHGFPSWPKFVQHLRNAGDIDSPEAQFEAAADAIITGDIAALRHLLRANPKLVHLRSSREHAGTLLHYVSANGVESYRQKTPKNIVEIAELLLKSGADVNAEADVYGGGCETLGLVATSVHPELAGVQEPLMQLLLDYGSVIEKPNLPGKKHSAVIACFANGRLRAGEFLAAHGAELDLESAAGLGRIDLVKTFFHPDRSLKPSATKKQLQGGLIWACMYGREEVAAFLLEHGADPLDRVDNRATPLHWAAGSGSLSIVKLLLDRGAPLEEINAWGGTVLGHAGWGFEHGAPDADFVPVFELLLEAGAKIRGSWLAWIEKVKGRSVEEKARVAEVFRRHGATA